MVVELKSSSELPIGYNMICKGDYLDPDRTDNTQRNTNYVGKYCGSTMNEIVIRGSLYFLHRIIQKNYNF